MGVLGRPHPGRPRAVAAGTGRELTRSRRSGRSPAPEIGCCRCDRCSRLPFSWTLRVRIVPARNYCSGADDVSDHQRGEYRCEHRRSRPAGDADSVDRHHPVPGSGLRCSISGRPLTTPHGSSRGGSFPVSPPWCWRRRTSAARTSSSRAASATQWHRVGGGFLPVCIVRVTAGVCDRRALGQVRAHKRGVLVVGGPVFHHPVPLVIAVWWINSQRSAPVTAGDLLLSPAPRCWSARPESPRFSCLFLFLFPRSAIAIWPWTPHGTDRAGNGRDLRARRGRHRRLRRAAVDQRADPAQVEGVMLLLISMTRYSDRTAISTPANR